MKLILTRIFGLLLLLLISLRAAAQPNAAQPDAVDRYRELQTWRAAPALTAAQKSETAQLLRDAEPMIRLAAAEVLLAHAPLPADAIAPLAAAVVNDGDSTVRGTAAAALAAAGPDAFGPIQQILLGPDLRARQTMATALRALDPVPAPLQPYVEWASPPYALRGPSLHPNSGFEAGLLGWTVALQNGAQGDWAIDDTRFRDGRHSLRLTKTNGVGYLLLRSTLPVVLPPDKASTTWRGWFHSEKAPVSSMLLFRLTDEKGEPAKDVTGGSARWQSQSLLRNTPRGVWAKRLLTVKPATAPRRYFLEVALYGNPCTVWLDDLEFPARPWEFDISDLVPSQPAPDAAASLQRIKERAAVAASVEAENNRAELQINGRPAPPMLHMPFIAEVGDFAAFQKAGVSLQTVLLSFDDATGQFTNGRATRTSLAPVWPTAKTNQYDFREPLRRVARAAEQAPDANLIIGFHINWPRDYVAAHPDTAWINARGEKAFGNWLYFKGFGKELAGGDNWWPSPYLNQPVDDAAAVIRAFMAELKSTPYARMVAACFVSGGHDGQFYIKERDYSPAATVAWRDWLRAKYSTIEKLAAAWHRPLQNFDEIAVPPERQAYQTSKNQSQLFFDPLTETDQRDYEEFRTERMWRVKERLLQAADDGLGRDLIGLSWNMGGAVRGNYAPLLNSRALDGVIVQPTYQYRMPGLVGGVEAPYSSYARHGKLVVKELDTRSWLRETYHNETTSMKISTPMSRDEFIALHRKEAGQSLAEDAAWWYFDISGNAFRHPGIMREIARTSALYRELLQKPRTFAPQVAIVHSDDSYVWSRTTHYGFRKMAQWALDYQDMEYSTSGVPADQYFLQDFMALPDVERYKIVVFNNAYHLSEAERNFVNRLKSNGRTLIWQYAAGYLSERGLSTTSMNELTGIKIETAFAPQRQRALAVTSADPLAKNLLPQQGMDDTFRTQFRLDTDDSAFDAQRFWIDDPQAVPLARYSADDKTAIAVRRFNDWTSIYVAPLAGISGELLHNAATNAGAFTSNAPGKLITNLNDRFLSLHALQSGTYDITLPRAATVAEFDSGKTVASHAQHFSVTLEAGQSRWFVLR